MNVLHLTLKKQWFDMILAGKKKEEYRELNKYWNSRLRDKKTYLFRNIDLIVFKNGYSKNARSLSIECKGIKMGNGNVKWGAKANNNYFILMLGNIIGTMNCTKKSIKPK